MTSIASIPRKLPLLLVTEDVLLPGSSIRVSVTSSANIAMVKSRLLSKSSLSSSIIGVLPKEPGQFDSDDVGALHNIGTAALVVQVTGTNWPRPSFTLLVTGLCRFRLDKLVMEVPYPVGVVTQLDKLSIDDEDDDENPEFAALVENFRSESTKLLDMLDVSSPVVARLKKMLNSIPHTMLADLVASLTKASFTEKLEILDAIDLMERFKKALPLLVRQVKMLEVIRKGTSLENNSGRRIIVPFRMNIGDTTKGSKRVDDEGDTNSDTNDLLELQTKLKEAKLPPQAKKVAVKDLQRLKRMGPFSPEHGVIRSWLELISELPWARASQETLDIHKARKDLDADHYAMDKLKRRVLEYLAVRQLKNTLRGPILCFVGPPGVGKTSVGRSIANTLGREFYRISLGGICNQSDIRGHRRTYIGSMPGRIIQGLKVVGVNNPVFLLDEIDKMGSGMHGDPASALLEVLDPEQNCTFVDHYLNVPFDLSQVMFIATANTTKSIPAPLLDRMEIIHVPGYTQEEKMQIAERHLLPKQLREHGLDSTHMQLPQDSLKTLIAQYTREAGVRTLERKLGALCRAVAVRVAEMKLKKPSEANIESISDEALTDVRSGEVADGRVDAASCAIPPQLPILLDEAALEDILGPPIYDSDDIWSRLGVPGVAVGLAWTQTGGHVMMVEASKMEGDGEIVLTGQLGNIMQESAHLALNWVRTAAREYGLKLDGEMMSHTDIHIHFPAGAVGKDGPSAGVTIATALVSLFSGRPVASDVAMTGEITLRGIVLPVGGIKEKVLAAHRAGLRRVILPKKCEKDLVDIPESIKKDLFFIPVTHVDEVLQAAFEGGFHANVELDQVSGALGSKL
ncbi:lon protease homolog 2, peroxisomal-like isoform X1 [Thrips palmi]|uniref:Lon protease homolog n=1 Tax=Thrips palmi TaxID=161013 RepID=A0A6P9AI44_THRPL|nr:lon protease homolog 2, peroxisomal-like isoform X1 [Thrips palmi]